MKHLIKIDNRNKRTDKDNKIWQKMNYKMKYNIKYS